MTTIKEKWNDIIIEFIEDDKNLSFTKYSNVTDVYFNITDDTLTKFFGTKRMRMFEGLSRTEKESVVHVLYRRGLHVVKFLGHSFGIEGCSHIIGPFDETGCVYVKTEPRDYLKGESYPIWMFSAFPDEWSPRKEPKYEYYPENSTSTIAKWKDMVIEFLFDKENVISTTNREEPIRYRVTEKTLTKFVGAKRMRMFKILSRTEKDSVVSEICAYGFHVMKCRDELFRLEVYIHVLTTPDYPNRYLCSGYAKSEEESERQSSEFPKWMLPPCETHLDHTYRYFPANPTSSRKRGHKFKK
jgi:hypothetical protein